MMGQDLLLDGRKIKVPGCEGGNFIGPTILKNVTVKVKFIKPKYLDLF